MIMCMRASWSEFSRLERFEERRQTLTLAPNSDTQPESQPIDARTHYTPNISKFLLWEGELVLLSSPSLPLILLNAEQSPSTPTSPPNTGATTSNPTTRT